jgi:ATP-dependent 26S proteasome regulatory subunit
MSRQENDRLTLSYFLNLLDGSLCVEENIFIMTTNYKNTLDKAIYRVGRVDVLIEFKLSDHYQIQQIFKSMTGREINIDILKRIPEDKYPPADIIFEILKYMYMIDMKDEKILEPFLRIE